MDENEEDWEIPWPDDVDIDAILQRLRRRAEDDDFLALVFQKYD